jgi:glutathione S-transferase
MNRLYDYLPSGSGYKVRLLLAQLNIACARVELSITKGKTCTPEFVAKKPNGRILVLEIGDDACLAESNAILAYLAEPTPFLPADRLDRARVMQWLFFEQYSHEPHIAVARFWLTHGEPSEEQRRRLSDRHTSGYAALDVMEAHLAECSFLVADEGGFDLAPYGHAHGWFERVASEPEHIPITQG